MTVLLLETDPAFAKLKILERVQVFWDWLPAWSNPLVTEPEIVAPEEAFWRPRYNKLGAITIHKEKRKIKGRQGKKGVSK